MSLHIVIDGRPQPWARTQGGRNTRPFTPAHVRQYANLIKLSAQAQRAGGPLLAGAINLAVKAYIPIPTSMPKYKRALALAGDLRPITNPDLSNYIKLVEDALNKVVWKDDSQVISLDGSGKWYSDKPRLEIEVTTYP